MRQGRQTPDVGSRSRNPRNLRRSPWLVRLILVGLIVGMSGGIPNRPALPVVAQAGGNCTTSGPATGAYTVEVCLASAVGDELVGDAEMTASVELITGTLPESVQVEFSLAKLPSTGDRNILTDYLAPYSFVLPTDRYADGQYRLTATAEFSDDFDADSASVELSFANQVGTAPASTGEWEPTTGQPGSPVVVAAVGDGAGGFPETDAVADLVESWEPNLLLYLGDVYKSGTYPEFINYYEPTLGRMKAITNPVPGNHESGAGYQGYFDYWNTNSHFYVTEVAGWQLIGLNNMEEYGYVRPGTEQYDWLQNQLNADECSIVFFHEPRWGLSRQGNYNAQQPLWELLASSDVELALAAHEHNYQRWLPLDAAGQVSDVGVTQFVVGTGGHDLESFGLSDGRLAGAAEYVPGALRLELSPTGAAFAFIAPDGTVLDTGTIPCEVSGLATLSRAKSKPEGRVEATLASFTPNGEVTLRWEDGTVLGDGPTDAEGTATVSFRTPTAAYGTYQVTAEDGSGRTATAQLVVIPRVSLSSSEAPAGTGVQVALSGFAAHEMVEILLEPEAEGSVLVLGSATAAEDGRAAVLVTIPTETAPGAYKLRAVPVREGQGSASAAIHVGTAEASPVADP